MRRKFVREKSTEELGKRCRLWEEKDVYHGNERDSHFEHGYLLEDEKIKTTQNPLSALYRLKVLNLKGSENLIKASDYTTSSNLEFSFWKVAQYFKAFQRFMGKWNVCWSFVLMGPTLKSYIPSSIGNLRRLKLLNLKTAKVLGVFQSKLEWNPLKYLLYQVAQILKAFQRLMIAETLCLPRSISGCKSLKTLNISGCYEVEYLPENLQQQEFLEELKFEFIKRAKSDYNLICCLYSLKELDLSGNNFISIPSSLTRFSKLQYLGLSNCKELKSLPELLTSIANVWTDGCAFELVANPSKVYNSTGWAWFCAVHCYRLAENINALTLLKKHLKVFANSRKIFYIIIPGSEIPKSFSQQRGGASIKIHLPTNIRNDSQWMGIAFCCIFVSDDTSRDENVMCKAVIQGRNPRVVDWCGLLVGKESGQPIMKDHIFLRYWSPDILYPFFLENEGSERETKNLSTSDCYDILLWSLGKGEEVRSSNCV
ncbi:hypothetical protein CXB51_029891 [Gossypium anomalum]|uniref:C-JID domain-containing protein n=1 Tax=Gossypium anomalum TaxID=47600 RepID=A0A8J6CP22_9ROSI|nr:hypothetical protein CXB51_029891 [Gossypium anomalum]